MQRGKSPGLNSLPPEFYTAFWDFLGPLLLNMIQFSIQKGVFSRDVTIAVITLLLKKDKNPTECGNYRPLFYSLLNADVICQGNLPLPATSCIFTSSLWPDWLNKTASGLWQCLPIAACNWCSNRRQNSGSCFIPGHNGGVWPPWVVFFVVVVGFGGDGLWRRLYKNDTVVIFKPLCNGSYREHLFHSVPCIYLSSRQGCPLSPTLFALSLEPLVQIIWLLLVIKPITVHNTHHHLALYAEDILVFLWDLLQFVPHLLSMLDEFGALSAFQINWLNQLCCLWMKQPRPLLCLPIVPWLHILNTWALTYFPLYILLWSTIILRYWTKSWVI